MLSAQTNHAPPQLPTKSYMMRRLTVIAPAVHNDGTRSFYREQVRAALRHYGYSGWTEHETLGYWKGQREPGTLFEVFVLDRDAIEHAQRIARLARSVMTDQEAIQVTIDPAPHTVIEA